MGVALASLRELLEIVRRRGSLAWSTQEDERAFLLLARAVALALREEAPSNVSAQANSGLEPEGTDEVASGGEVDEKASGHGERRKSGREAQSSNRESGTFGGHQSSDALKSIGTNSDSSSQAAHGSGLRVPLDAEMLDSADVLKDMKAQLAAEVLRGGILTQTLAVKDPSHLEALGMAAKASLKEVLRNGAAGAGDFWAPTLKVRPSLGTFVCLMSNQKVCITAQVPCFQGEPKSQNVNSIRSLHVWMLPVNWNWIQIRVELAAS
jgi:hypothetical protein